MADPDFDDPERELREILSRKGGREAALQLILGDRLNERQKEILKDALRELLDELGDLARFL